MMTAHRQHDARRQITQMIISDYSRILIQLQIVRSLIPSQVSEMTQITPEAAKPRLSTGKYTYPPVRTRLNKPVEPPQSAYYHTPNNLQYG